MMRASAMRAYSVRFDENDAYMRVLIVKEGFSEEECGNVCTVCMCVKDGGAGRKRGGDSVCEKKKKEQIV